MSKKWSHLIVSLFVALLLQVGPAMMAYASTTTLSAMPPTMHEQTVTPLRHILDHKAMVVSLSSSSQKGGMAGKCCIEHNGLCDLVTLEAEFSIPQRHGSFRRGMLYGADKLPSFIIQAFLRPPIRFFAG